MAGREGQQLGDYRLIRKLGEGSFGEVYEAEQVYLQTRVAIKVLHESISQEERQALLMEARLMASLRHPHIAQVLGYSEQEAIPYVVMQLAPGDTLRNRYPKGTIQPLETILSHVKQAAEGLQYAYAPIADVDVGVTT